MVIAYLLGYSRDKVVECCGMFRDYKHFEAFKRVEEFAGRHVYAILFMKE